MVPDFIVVSGLSIPGQILIFTLFLFTPILINDCLLKRFTDLAILWFAHCVVDYSARRNFYTVRRKSLPLSVGVNRFQRLHRPRLHMAGAQSLAPSVEIFEPDWLDRIGPKRSALWLLLLLFLLTVLTPAKGVTLRLSNAERLRCCQPADFSDDKGWLDRDARSAPLVGLAGTWRFCFRYK